ncbi:hypothetical protein J2Y63_002152 [Shinella sp. BE166]|uniref:hypothetical protein n=1 Tax=Shinella sp. BE166 TaxID=3373918 RepID=UPI003EB8D3FC
MIDPPTRETGTNERKVELDQTVDYAVQLLEEEAHLIGWQRAEFLASIIDVANARLATLEEEARLAGGTPVGDKRNGKRLP